MLTARIAGWVFSVSVELVLRTVEDDAAERLAERRVRLLEGLAANRKRLRQGAAHADLLCPLSWKEEGNHECDTAVAAMSAPTRSMKRCAEKR